MVDGAVEGTDTGAPDAVSPPPGSGTGGPHRAVFTGEARTDTVVQARRWARGVLAAWDADALEWELSQLLTEVVTNAVLHAQTPVRVVLEHDAASGRLRCEVSDGSPVLPRVRRHSTQATTGRGLRLLDSVATSWGTQRSAAGKTVWFEVDGAGSVGFDGEDFAALVADLQGEGPAQARPAGPETVAALRSRPTPGPGAGALPPLLMVAA